MTTATRAAGQKTSPKPSSPPKNGFSLISNQKLLALYSAMLKCRMIEDHSRVLIKRNRQSGFWSSTLGQEAAAVGVAIDLHRGDTIAPAHWAHSALSSIHPSLKVVEEFEHATTVAMATKEKKATNIAVAFLVADFTNLDSWNEALTVASTRRLPMIFVSQGNETATTAARKSRDKTPALPTIPVDGHDVVAVYRVATEAIFHARKDHGPTLIKCLRDQAGDPLVTMEKYLNQKGLITPEVKSATTAALRKELKLDI